MTEPEIDPSEEQAQQVVAIHQKAMEVYYQFPDQAAPLLEQAITLAQTGAFASQPYRPGLSASLAALARLKMETRPDLAAQYCLQVLSLLEGYPVSAPLIEAKNCLGWIHFHLGDYSTAMEWALQGLRQSQEFSLALQEAAALDLIGNIHGTLNEFAQALRAHEAAIQIARSSPRRTIEANYMNNMAMTLLAMGNYETALETSLKCLHIFQELKTVLETANCYDTLAQIYLGMGETRQAEINLLNGLELLESIENPLLKTYMQKSLGRVYLAQNDLPKAMEQVQWALALAQKNGLRGEQAECYQVLASIHEQQSDFRLALQHFKQFYETSKEVSGDTTAKRLTILNVIHAVENAKHEAEIFRLRNIELQSEIDERKRVQVALEELATRDQLTSLYNRRYFLEKSEQEYERATRYHHPIAVMMLDLDHFKLINDTYGHPVGDQVLALVGKRLKELTRGVDIAGRMGGEEFALVFPETGLAGASQAADRLCQSFSDEPFSLSIGSIRVTISIGLTCYPPEDSGDLKRVQNLRDAPPFDTLLLQADKALYIAKNSGRSQTQLFSQQAKDIG